MSKRRYTTTTVRDTFARMEEAMSSFNELASASPSILFDLKSIYPISKLRDRVEAENGGDVTQADGEFVASTSANADSSVIFRSVERARYVAGFDGIPGIAIRVIDMPVGNQVIEWGNTDFVNGYAVGIDADGMFTRLYSGGEILEERRRENWNNPAPDELDPQMVNIYRTPYRWYGSGPYRLMIDTVDSKGRGVVIGLDTTSSGSDGPITQDPNQPISVRIQNNGTASAASVAVMGRQYFVNGDYNPNQRIIGEHRLSQSIGTTFTPLIALRKRSGIYQGVSVKLSGLDMLASGASVLWNVLVMSELTDGSWAVPRLTDGGNESACEFNLTATGFTDQGIQIHGGGFVPEGQGNTSGSVSMGLPTLDFPGDGQIICLAARAVSGTATVSSVFRAMEEW